MKKLAKIQENINALRQRMSANTKGLVWKNNQNYFRGQKSHRFIENMVLNSTP